jgi:hypothetical protein
MNNEEFKRKLNEVAEWHIPKIKLNGTERRKLRGRLSNEDKYQDEHEQIFFEIFGGVNPTTTPEITKVRRAACTCEDCGKHCPNGREKEAKLYETNGKKHWREKCLTCKLSMNPRTGVFDLPNATAASEWNGWIRKDKGQPPVNAKLKIVSEYELEENDSEIIKRYTGWDDVD